MSWLALAFAGGALAYRCGVPILVGYLAIGAGLGLAGVPPPEGLTAVAQAGVELLLFGVGLHLRLRTVMNRVVILGALTELAVCTAIFVAIAVPLGMEMHLALLAGLCLSFSSTVLAAKDLESRQEIGAFYGRITIGILLVQDIVAIAVLGALGDTFRYEIMGLIPVLALCWWILPRLLDKLDDDGLLVALACMLPLSVGYLFHELGGSREMGALLMGALLAHHPKAKRLQRLIWGVKEVLLIAFFLHVGMLAVPQTPDWPQLVLMAAVLIAVLPLKSAVFFGVLAALGLRARTAFLSGAALTSYSEFTLMAGFVALQEGVIDTPMFSMLTLATAASFAINLPIYRLVHSLYSRWKTKLARLQRKDHHRDRTLHSVGRATHLIVGMGRTGSATFDHFIHCGLRPVGLDSDPVVVERQLGAGRRVVLADAFDPELWDDLNLDELQGAVVTVPHIEARLRAVSRIKERSPLTRVVTYALSEAEAERLRMAGVDDVHHLLSDAGVRLAESADPGLLESTD